MVVFNIYALLQAILLFVIGLIFYYTGLGDMLDNSGLTTKSIHIVVLYAIYFILAATDRAGIKGRLFWVPTWALCLIFIMLYNMAEHDYYERHDFWTAAFKVFNYIFPLYLFYRMLYKLDAIFAAKFREAQIVLNNMDKSDEAYEAGKKTFWAQISHTFAQPSITYLFAYPFYKFFHRRTIPREAFIAHNMLLLETIKPRLIRPESNYSIGAFYNNLKNGRQTGNYSHDANSMQKLAKVIESEYNVYKDGQ